MPGHKLFTEVDRSPQFNSSLDESNYAGNKTKCETATMTSKPGPSKNNSLRKEGVLSNKIHPSFTEMDLVKKSPVEKKNNAATQPNLVSQKDSDLDSCSDSDSDSDSMGVSGFFSSSNQKLPYSYEEDEEILKFVLHGQLIFRVGSILLWKDLERLKRNPRRTYQSLKNRFLRNIKPHLFTTYRHLIPDKETVEKILLKFPELKKQVGRQETLTRIKLPYRNPGTKTEEGNTKTAESNTKTAENNTKTAESNTKNAESNTKTAEVNVPSTSVQEFQSKLKNSQVPSSVPDPVIECEPSPPDTDLFNESSFHRKVTINGTSLTILVNLKYKHPPSQRTGIYEKFEKLKLKNNLILCAACGRYGGPDAPENADSGADSDVLISNSVECKKSERSFREERITQSRKRKSLVPDSHSSSRSFSPSLLNDINEISDLDDSGADNAKREKRMEKILDSAILLKEVDSTPEEPSPVSDKETDSIYQNTVAEFRKLIDSDEEEALVKKCLRKNRKCIGFDSNLSVEGNHVDSYFIKSSSPDLGSACASDTL